MALGNHSELSQGPALSALGIYIALRQEDKNTKIME